MTPTRSAARKVSAQSTGAHLTDSPEVDSLRYKAPALPMAERIHDLIGRMTIKGPYQVYLNEKPVKREFLQEIKSRIRQ
jgi:hypothetical protein